MRIFTLQGLRPRSLLPFSRERLTVTQSAPRPRVQYDEGKVWGLVGLAFSEVERDNLFMWMGFPAMKLMI